MLLALLNQPASLLDTVGTTRGSGWPDYASKINGNIASSSQLHPLPRVVLTRWPGELQHLKILSFGDADQLTSCDPVHLILGEPFNPAPGPMNRHRINLRVVTEAEIETRTLLRREPGTC